MTFTPSSSSSSSSSSVLFFADAFVIVPSFSTSATKSVQVLPGGGDGYYHGLHRQRQRQSRQQRQQLWLSTTSSTSTSQMTRTKASISAATTAAAKKTKKKASTTLGLMMTRFSSSKLMYSSSPSSDDNEEGGGGSSSGGEVVVVEDRSNNNKISSWFKNPFKLLDVCLGWYFGQAIQVIENIQLPKSTTGITKYLRWLFNLDWIALRGVVSFYLDTGTGFFVAPGPTLGNTLQSVIGQTKTSGSLKHFQHDLINAASLQSTIPTTHTSTTSSTQYQFFGNDQNRFQELLLLLKTNPFYASALTKTKTNTDGNYYLELKSFDYNNDLDTTTTTGTSTTSTSTRYQTFVSTLYNNTSRRRPPRVNFRFDSKLTKLVSIAVLEHDDEGNRGDAKPSITIYDSNDISEDSNQSILHDTLVGIGMYQLIFYAASIHTMLHVFHYLMTECFVDASSTQNFSAMKEWATFYSSDSK